MQKRIIYIIFILIMGFGFTNIVKPKPYVFPDLTFFPKMPISNENPVTVEGVTLGRYLFYDEILSLDTSISCGTCHQQKFAFSDNRKFSKGIDGSLMKRNTLPLFNLAWYPDLFWDGRAKSIEQQVFEPVSAHNEMGLDWKTATERIQNNDFYVQQFQTVFGRKIIDSLLISKAIAQFERSLISNNSKYDQVLRGAAYFTKIEYEGFVIMNDQSMGNCLHCHITDAHALGTNAQFSNNGLDKAADGTDFLDQGRAEVTNRKMDFGVFKVPSLRNIGLTAPYMHDGRFENLEAVLDFYSDNVQHSFSLDHKMSEAANGGVQLNEDQKIAVIAFLHTLTDSTFINNSEFSDPFIN